MAKHQKQGKIDSWGICWHLSVFLRKGLVLYPRQSLVQNFGVDDSGAHGAGHALLQRPLGDIRLDPTTIRYPEGVEVDVSAMSGVEHLLRSMQPGPVGRLANWLKS
jgi:hypothetical protein